MNAIVDVHAHCLPKEYLDAMTAAGVHDVEGFPLPTWSEAEHLAEMDRNGLTSSILSVSTPGLDFVSGQQRLDLARRLNEDMAERRERTRGRFGAFALIPLPDVKASLKEIEYALDTLHMDGVGVLSNYAGSYLGDEAFIDVFAELNRRCAVLFVHPTAPPHWTEFSVGYPATALEYPFDVTRWLLQVISSGMLRRFTKIKLIATHGGGTMPFLASRIAPLVAMQSKLNPKMDPDEVQGALKEVFYDSTAVTAAITFDCYKAFVPADKRLFGSDHPFMPEANVPPALRAFNATQTLSPEDKVKLEFSNAESLFPKLAKLWPKP